MLRELLKIYDANRANPGKPECTFAETLISNEGWLLRAVIKEWQSWTQPARFSFLPFPERTKVYSEAQLYTPFKARFQGDKLAEAHTHVDGIVGDFHIMGTKSGAALAPEWRYLAVFEAKMYSSLSSGTMHARGYDQVSRTVACMIHAILESDSVGDGVAHLIILYPADNSKIHPGRYAGDHVKEQIAARVRGYLSAKEHDQPDARFFAEWGQVLPRIHIQFLAWEDVIPAIENGDLDRFYTLCRRFNHS